MVLHCIFIRVDGNTTIYSRITDSTTSALIAQVCEKTKQSPVGHSAKQTQKTQSDEDKLALHGTIKMSQKIILHKKIQSSSQGEQILALCFKDIDDKICLSRHNEPLVKIE